MDGAFPSERGQEWPGRGGGRGGPSRGFRGTAENAKTKLCTRCNFAHGDEELRNLPPRDEGRGGFRGGYGGGRGYEGGGGGRGYGGRGRGGYDYPPAQGYGPPGGYGDGYGGGHGGAYNGGYGYEGNNGGPPQGGYGGGGGGHGGYGAPPGGGGPGGAMMPVAGSRPPALTDDQWAQQGYPVQGPNGWVMYRTKDTGEAYYHNYQSNTTVWDRPPEWPANM